MCAKKLWAKNYSVKRNLVGFIPFYEIVNRGEKKLKCNTNKKSTRLTIDLSMKQNFVIPKSRANYNVNCFAIVSQMPVKVL